MVLYSCKLQKGFYNYVKKVINHNKLQGLRHLNLSFNNLCCQESSENTQGSLTTFLSSEFGLIQKSLESLYLVKVGINKP